MIIKKTRSFIQLMKEDTTFRKIIIIILLLKLLVFSIGVAAYIFIPQELSFKKTTTGNVFLDPWLQLDARAYLDIAMNGYNSEFNDNIGNYAWLPFYPFLIQIFSFIGFGLSAVLISNIASFIALAMLYILIKDEFGSQISYKSTLLLLFFPTSFFFVAAYSESLFLLFSIITFYYAKKKRWLFTGIAGFLAALTRSQGILLFLPILYLYIKSNPDLFQEIRKYNFRYFFANIRRYYNIFFLLLIPLGLFIFLFYHFLITSNFFASQYTQLQYSRFFSYPWNSFINTFLYGLGKKDIFGFSIEMMSIFFTVFLIGLFIYAYRYKKIGHEYSIYIFLSALYPTFTNTLSGVIRFMIVVFPTFLLLSMLGENRKRLIFLKIVYIVFFAIMIFSIINFVNERVLYYELLGWS